MSSATTPDIAPVIGVVMGSSSDWETMKHAADILTEFGVPFEEIIASMHLFGPRKTPRWS